MATAIEPLLRLPVIGRRWALSASMLLGLVRLADAVLVVGSGLIAAWLTLAAPLPVWLPLVLALAALLGINLLTAAGTYRPATLRSFAEQAMRAGLAWPAALLLLACLERYAGPAALPLRTFLLWLPLGLLSLLATRLALRLLLRRWDREGRMAQSIVVVGASEHGKRLVERLRQAGSSVRLIGLFDDRRTRVPHHLSGYPVLGGLDDLIALARRHPLDQVIIALPWDAETRLLECLRRLRDLPVDVRLCPDLIGFHLNHRGVTHLAGIPLMNVFDKPLAGWAYLVKGIEDRLVAAFVLLLTAPLLLVIALAVRLTSGGPVFFRQKRYGLNNEPIEVLKFRTMRAGSDEPADAPLQQAKRDDPRVTPLGFVDIHLSQRTMAAMVTTAR